ncbi:DUF4403 family protein [Pelagovum pacificum]|uniref:DUF4403 family protein n=1 Tax=Pelagovum pacificum TaxID=2588711 RepID=A0A5C5GC14_9RHOB|nr:DUF4403 family protein [Pelagovum pacificum]QQA42050.1 DUF4403 family protein [Pelagovum pacificum]TNY31139.1 DUF4403 family protein [Pelagovum pacificum]
MKRIALGLCLLASPAAPDTVAERMDSPGTHVSASLEVPFEALRLLIEQDIRPVYEGREQNPSNSLRDDRIDWSAEVTDLSVGPTQDKGFYVSAVIQGEAEMRGRLAGIMMSETIDLEVRAEVRSRPVFRPDWTIALDATGRARIREAEIGFLGLGIDIGETLQPDLDRAFARGLEERAEAVAGRPVLRGALLNLWRDACREVPSLGGQARFRPTAIATTQPTFGPGGIRFTVVVSTELEMTPEEEASACPPMPDRLELLAAQ